MIKERLGCLELWLLLWRVCVFVRVRSSVHARMRAHGMAVYDDNSDVN